jgi:hypothetical protein
LFLSSNVAARVFVTWIYLESFILEVTYPLRDNLIYRREID